jgi:hypothetical protein
MGCGFAVYLQGVVEERYFLNQLKFNDDKSSLFANLY